jgi:hypothetical protein
MATLINVCPNCKNRDIKKITKGKYNRTGCLLMVLGVPLLLFYGFGLIFIIIGIVMGCITETIYKCENCNTEWK